MTLHEVTYGKQGDISNICNFGWYQWVYYITPKSFPEEKECLGRVLGPINNEGSYMSQSVVTSKATIVPQRSIRPLSISELNSETEQHKRETFDNFIKEKLGDAMTNPSKPPPSAFIPYADGDLDLPALNKVDEYPVHTDDVFEHPSQIIESMLN